MNLLKLEFDKCRHRGIVLICVAVLAVQVVWMWVFLIRQASDSMPPDWMLLLYNLALVDAIMLPLSVATLVSRNCEVEHKGSTWKLLETLATPSQLYTVKLIWGALVLAGLLVVRTGLFLVLGVAVGLSGSVPVVRLVLFTLISWTVSMMVCALQQGLSMRFANQAAPLISGIFGSFMGLLSLLFPVWLIRCVPWGYYGLMSLVGMDWNETTRVTRFFWRLPQMTDVVLLLVWALVFLVVGRILFVKKEV